MKEHPIIFNGPMVKAILDGRKTMTRRPMKPQPRHDPPKVQEMWNARNFCYPCDHLWVRETFRFDTNYKEETITYKADNAIHHVQDNAGLLIEEDFGKWKPSIHMPRWASRITLEVTDVRVERVQEISDIDCFNEGMAGMHIVPVEQYPLTLQGAYGQLWESIYSKTYPWTSNPWVWVISFKRVQE